jgi:hypothetical protein
LYYFKWLDLAQEAATTCEGDLFRARIDQIINMKHELVQLAGAIGLGPGRARPAHWRRFEPALYLDWASQ